MIPQTEAAMIRRIAPWAGPLCALALLLFFYRSALFEGGQFGYRDAAHFYYPLYQKVQSEWAAGRLPLWDPSENAGMPLLGNPTAAVLYPGKLIFAACSYPWAVRLYAVLHSALAFAGVWVLLRGWRASRTAAALAGLSYAFGAPVLFQYCNIIYLVGAAWTPWGCWAVDRWLRLRRVAGLLALGVVLAMQVLGGDPESAYLIGLCAGGYAALLVRAARRAGRPPVERRARGRSRALAGLVIGSGLAAWVAASLLAAIYLPGFRPLPTEGPWGPVARWLQSGRVPGFRPEAYEGPVPGVGWAGPVPRVVLACWGVVGLAWVIRWWRFGTKRVPIVPLLAGLVGAAALAGLLAAVQLLPVAEFTAISARATDEGPHDIYPFSLEPYRLVELIWPGFYGRNFGSSVTWMGIVLPKINHRTWVPSLYLGGLTLAFALAALGRPRSAASVPGGATDAGQGPWRTWMIAIVLVSTIGSFGEFASPIWAARFVPDFVASAGPHDSYNSNAVRLDGWLRDGDGSPYGLMATFLPGFHSFRFPSKLFTFAALGLACLAGLGWDRAMGQDRRGARGATLAGLAASLVGLTAVAVQRATLVAWFESLGVMTMFGPLDAPGAVRDLMLALGQGGLVLAAAWALMTWGRRRPELAGVAAVAVMGLDLGWANASMVRTVPQSDFEANPTVLAQIAAAEQADPSPGPYRIYRAPIWNPPGWREATSGDRVRDFVRWELDTIQPKYGLLHDVEYTKTIGVAELYDYEWFFSPFPRRARPDAARYLRITPGDQIVYYPRRGFDLWNSRYFVLPYLPRWDDPDRGIAAFLPNTTRIYPPPDAFRGPDGTAAEQDYVRQQDFQVLRNDDAFPRAWVVHDVRFKPPIVGLNRKERRETVEEILFADDPFWHDSARTLFDPRNIAWIETENQGALAGYLTRGNPTRAETVTVVEQAPDRVVLEARLDRAGLVILADGYYPGWVLTIDGQPAPIFRANRMMRGAAVAQGTHRLVYTYRPASVRAGAMVTLVGLVILAAGSIWAVRGRTGE